jgi:hypothetical protein
MDFVLDALRGSMMESELLVYLLVLNLGLWMDRL